jgi:ABC-type Fe3+ transport system substrate-binding protein
MKIQSRALSTGSVAIGLVVLAACSSGGVTTSGAASPSSSTNASAASLGIPQSLVKSACAEGKLTLYQLDVTPAVTNLNAAFRKAYPCLNVTSSEGVGGTMLTKYQAAVAAKTPPDYLELSLAGDMEQMASQGQFLKFTPVEGSNVSALVPGLVYADFFLQMGVMYNTSVVTPAMISQLKSWSDIDNPAFAKLNIGLVSPAAGGTAETAWYYLVHTLGQSFAENFVKTHHITPFPSAQPAAEALASGQVDLLLPEASSSALALWKAGAPVRFAIPSPEVTTATAIAIPVGAPDPSAAELYEDYVLSSAGQNFYEQGNYGFPSNSTIPFSNPVAQQSWWSVPSQSFSYQAEAVNAASSSLVALFNSWT